MRFFFIVVVLLLVVGFIGFTVTNLGSRDAEVVLTHTLVGELHRSTPRALESRTSMTDAVNFDNVLEWSFTLAPGETRTFRAEYSTFALVRKRD